MHPDFNIRFFYIYGAILAVATVLATLIVDRYSLSEVESLKRKYLSRLPQTWQISIISIYFIFQGTFFCICFGYMLNGRLSWFGLHDRPGHRQPMTYWFWYLWQAYINPIVPPPGGKTHIISPVGPLVWLALSLLVSYSDVFIRWLRRPHIFVNQSPPFE